MYFFVLLQIKLKEAENEDTIKLLSGKICESELEVKTQREDVPEDSIASLQEELAASKLREAESNLALKDLKSKVGELNTMWLKHINKPAESNSGTPAEMPSTPKKVVCECSNWIISTKKFLIVFGVTVGE